MHCNSKSNPSLLSTRFHADFPGVSFLTPQIGGTVIDVHASIGIIAAPSSQCSIYTVVRSLCAENVEATPAVEEASQAAGASNPIGASFWVHAPGQGTLCYGSIFHHQGQAAVGVE